MTLQAKSTLPSLPFDILSYIGDHADRDTLLALSLTSKSLRDAVTHHIFSRVCITGTWEDAEPHVELMSRSDICALVKTFQFDIFVSEIKSPPERRIPTPSFQSQLRDTLIKMKHLNSLTFIIPEESSQLYEDSFARDPPLVFPSITSLTLGPYTHFMVDYCPLLRRVSTGGDDWLDSPRGGDTNEHSFALIQALANRPLEELILGEWYSVSLTAAILKALPYLPSLGMNGGSYEDPLDEHIPILSQFKGLKRLQLGHLSGLDVGFFPPRCGNAYWQPGVAERVAKEARVVKERVVQDLSMVCPHLEELRFSDSAPILIRRSKDGLPVDFIWS